METLVYASAFFYWFCVGCVCLLMPPDTPSAIGQLLTRAGLFIIMSLPVLLVAGMFAMMGVV